MSVGVAASALFGVGVDLWRSRDTNLVSRVTTGPLGLRRGVSGQWLEGLSSAWASLEEKVPQIEEGDDEVAHARGDGSELAREDSVADDAEVEGFIPPWLLAAVSVTHPAVPLEQDQPVLEN